MLGGAFAQQLSTVCVLRVVSPPCCSAQLPCKTTRPARGPAPTTTGAFDFCALLAHVSRTSHKEIRLQMSQLQRGQRTWAAPNHFWKYGDGPTAHCAARERETGPKPCYSCSRPCLLCFMLREEISRIFEEGSQNKSGLWAGGGVGVELHSNSSPRWELQSTVYGQPEAHSWQVDVCRN